MENQSHQQPATPEKVWATLDRIAEKQEKATLDMEKIRKRQKQTDRQMKQTDRQMKKLAGLFTSQWGKLMESLVEGDLVPLLQARGISVQSTHPRVRGRRNGEHYEFDILAGNGEEMVVVEVKTTLKADDVKQFLEKLNKFTEYEPVYRGKQVYGAVAYLRVEQDSELYAERQGLYVIRATGNSASIINDAGFVPRVFNCA